MIDPSSSRIYRLNMEAKHTHSLECTPGCRESECDHLTIVDYEYDTETIYGTCADCGIRLWTWLASEYGSNAGGGHWEVVE